MRILHLLSQNVLTGAEVYAQTLIEDQLQQGHEVFAISDQFHVELSIPWISKPISVNRWKTRNENIHFVRQLLLEKKIDVIHAHSRAAARVAHKARRGFGVGFVTTIHGRQHSSWGKRLFDTYGDYKILVCENLKSQFENNFRIAQGSTRVIRNPFPDSKVPELSTTLQRRIAFVGRSSGPKGQRLVELFEKGFYKYLEAHPEIQFDIVAGQTENFGQDFLAKIQSPLLSPQIRLLDHQGDLEKQLPQYDLVFAAGRVAVECLRVGTAVFSFGEATSHGLVTASNWQLNLASNFGDIGAEENLQLDVADLLAQLDTILNRPPDLSSRLELQKRARSEYSLGLISSLVLDTYKAALFKRHVPKGIPILMYHKVVQKPETGPHRIFVDLKTFEKHLKLFQWRGNTTMTFRELNEFWHLRKPYTFWPKLPLLLTFDDGYADNFENALPLLGKYQMRAVLFLLSDRSIQSNTWDPEIPGVRNQLMNPEQRQKIASSGLYEIGSHGVSHPHLPLLSNSEVRTEMEQSKLDLEKEFGTTPIAFAYPFGDLDARLPALARESGYEFAVNTDRGGLHFSDNRFSLFRVNVFPEDGLLSIWKKSSPFYRKRYFEKRGQ